ncbi:MAG: fibrillarin-like rRNA/tRNA 2'-O-methyltransferase [Methanomicrobiales archaeon]|nr:fibrillarin-like rRNA/tRNA 2'-O-methyltransferase [Methanomicrobiales archaeon]
MIWAGEILVSPGKPAAGERAVNGCRVWDPSRSKLAALYHLGDGPDLIATMRVLYLGASYGTTVSHVADYVEVVYAVDSASRPMQDLLRLCSHRKNIIPLLADAAHPERYMALVEKVDLVYQDIAQRDQAGIAIKNLHFLRPGCSCILMLKTRSIDVKRPPAEICAETVQWLSPFFRSVATTWLLPYHQDHAAIVCEGLI